MKNSGYESALLESQACGEDQRDKLREHAGTSPIREVPGITRGTPGHGGGRSRPDGGRASANVSLAGVKASDAPGPRPASHARCLPSPRPIGGQSGEEEGTAPTGEHGDLQATGCTQRWPSGGIRLFANPHPNRTPAPPRGRARAARRGGRAGTPSCPRQTRTQARDLAGLSGSAGRRREEPARNGPGAPTGAQGGARAGRARPGGGRPRTHITGHGAGPHPGSAGADRRGAGRCRPTRSLPAKRGSPWRRRQRRRLASLLLALAPGPAPPRQRRRRRRPGPRQRAAD